MNIRIEQLNPIIGDFEGNKSLILASLNKAESDNIDLLILPEMVVTGYPVQDLLENESFRERCYQVNEEIVTSTRNTALLFGTITPNRQQFGRKMYNSAILAEAGRQTGITHKTLLPTYDVFDDLRYFESNREFYCLELKGVQLGVTICEDIWYNQNEVQYHTYQTDPAQRLKEAGADIIINISASPYTKTKHENRKAMLRGHAKNLGLPVLYANQTGAHNEIVFDGDSLAVTSGAVVIARTEPFQPSFTDVVWDDQKKEIFPGKTTSAQSYPENKMERQFKALICGLRDYIRKTGITNKIVLGLSGGIDSALVCAIAVEALGSENVTAITMPTTFSSKGSVEDSRKQANNFGIDLFTLPVQTVYDEVNKVLHPVFEGTEFDVAEENIQSRIRGTLLMAYANKHNYFLLATGNKSEYAVGYATLYGDMNGALAVIGDLYKTEVYGLSRWLNEEYFKKEMIPNSVLTKPPSAELRPDQKDTDSLPPYEILDEILHRYIELQEHRNQITSGGFSADVVDKVLTLVDYSEYKRWQAAPILKLSSKSFGSGRRWPLVQKWTSDYKK